MKRLLPPLLLGFGIALALIIGKRMSTDAMAVMVGVAVGVAASVPTSLLLVALLARIEVKFGSMEMFSWYLLSTPLLSQLKTGGPLEIP